MIDSSERYGTNRKQSNTINYITYGIVALVLALIHLTFLRFIAFGGLTPDLLLILCIFIALKEGQFTGLFFGFGIGLFIDIISIDLIGTNALAKTIAAFIAGFFFKEGKAKLLIGSYKFLIILFVCSLVHNAIYFFFYIKPTEISFIHFFIKYGIAVSLYTTVFGIFLMLWNFPRKIV